MSAWNDLSMVDRANYIQLGVSNGITDLSVIIDSYNNLQKEGELEDFQYGGQNNPASFKGVQSGRPVEIAVYPDRARTEYVSSDVQENQGYQLDKADARMAEKAKADELVANTSLSPLDLIIPGLSPEDAMSMIPIVGDAMDIKDIFSNALNGNYKEVTVAVGSALLPGLVDKPIKYGGKFMADLWHSIGRHPIDKFKINRIARDAYDKGFIDDLSKIHKSTVKRGEFAYDGTSFYVPKGYKPKADKGFAMRHEIGHASETQDNIIQFTRGENFSPDYRYSRGDPNWSEQRADYIGTLGGTLTDKDVLSVPSSDSFKARVLSNPHLFKPSGEYTTWQPKDWFSYRADGKYDAEDVDALFSHVPEYLEIEKGLRNTPIAKAWNGDFRSLIQMHSAPYMSYTKGSAFPDKILSHSSESKFHNFDYRFFGKTDNGFYGRGFYFHPAIHFNPKTKRFEHTQSYGDEVYNVVTRAKSPIFPRGMKDPEWENVFYFNRPNSKFDFSKFDSVSTLPPYMIDTPPGAILPEVVIRNPNDVKSIIGNNGDFSELDDIYKATGGFITRTHKSRKKNMMGDGGPKPNWNKSLTEMSHEERRRELALRDAERKRRLAAHKRYMENLEKRSSSNTTPSSKIIDDAYLIQAALESQARHDIDLEVRESFERSQNHKSELESGYKESQHNLADQFLKSIEVASSIYALGNGAARLGWFKSMPRVEATFTNPTALKVTTLGGLGADVTQGLMDVKQGNTLRAVKDFTEAGLGVLSTVGAFNLYRFLPSRYRSVGQRVDQFLDWTIPIQGASSLL